MSSSRGEGGKGETWTGSILAGPGICLGRDSLRSGLHVNTVRRGVARRGDGMKRGAWYPIDSGLELFH